MTEMNALPPFWHVFMVSKGTGTWGSWTWSGSKCNGRSFLWSTWWNVVCSQKWAYTRCVIGSSMIIQRILFECPELPDLHQHLWTCISSLLMQICSICCMSDRCPMDWYCNSNFYGNAASKHCWCSGLCTKVEPCSLYHILEGKKKIMLVPRCTGHRKWEAEEDLWFVANMFEALVFAVIQMTGSALDQFLPGWVSFQPSDWFD